MNKPIENKNAVKSSVSDDEKPIIKEMENLEYRIERLSGVIHELNGRLGCILNNEDDDESGKGEIPAGSSELYKRLQDSNINLENLQHFITTKITERLEI